MRLRPINDTVIIDPDKELIAVDKEQSVLDVAKRGLILLPEKNMLMKMSNRATVISYGPKCPYKFKTGQRIIYDQFRDTPVWHIDGENRYRIIQYHYIVAVEEE